MPIQIATASSHVDLYDRLITWLQEDTGGPGWTLLREDTGASALFVAPGLTGTEEIFIGLNLNADSNTDRYSIGVWMFRNYNSATADLTQPGSSSVMYMTLWNTSMPYWFVANGQRLIVAAKVSTVYSALHAGKILPYGTPGEYPQPYFVSSVATSNAVRWSTVSEDNRNFWDPGNASQLLTPNGSWRVVQNWREAGGESAASSNFVYPFSSGTFNGVTAGRYRELRENVDGTYWTLPLIIHGLDPNQDIYGEIDGAFAVSGFNSASENIVTIGGINHLVVQDLHRTDRYYYAAIKLE